MHCPKCGNQQTSEEISFCTKCGLAMDDVKELLVPERREVKVKNKNKIDKANRQGLAMMLSGFVLITILAILREFLPIPKIYMIITALVFCIGGVIRMSLPYLFSGNDLTQKKDDSLKDYSETGKLSGEQFSDKSLPEAEYHPPIKVGANNFDTNELVSPSSVTENTTRKLEKKFNENNN